MARQFALDDPNAPTRVSGFWQKKLDSWAARRNKRLPDRGGHLPFHGHVSIVPGPGHVVGGTPNRVPPENAGALKVPMLSVPSGVAMRADFQRRALRRKVLKKEQAKVVLSPGFSGLHYAVGPRIRTLTPDGVRGTLKDQRHMGTGVEFYGQSVAPSSIVEVSNAARLSADPASRQAPYAPVLADPKAAAYSTAGMKLASKTAVAADQDVQTAADGIGVSGILPLVAVVALGYLLIRGH